MMLFLKVDGDPRHGWEGYQYVVNRTVCDARTSLLEQSAGGWKWTPKARIRYRVRGNEMELAIPRAAVGLADPARPVGFEFKWADNMQHEGDIMDFTVNGDAAPNGRFNYRFAEDPIRRHDAFTLQPAPCYNRIHKEPLP
jgi:hypothetical protein